MTFTPLKNFFSEELMSSYVVGLTYTSRDPDEPGIPVRTKENRAKLRELLPVWLKDGLVALGAPASGLVGPGASAARVSGKGEVT